MPTIRHLLRRVLAAVTCLSCGAVFGDPHGPNCQFQTFGGGGG